MGLFLSIYIELFMILGSFMRIPRSKTNLDQVFQFLPNHTRSSQIFWVLSLMSHNTHRLPNQDIFTALPITLGGKIISIEVEVIDRQLKYNLLLRRN